MVIFSFYQAARVILGFFEVKIEDFCENVWRFQKM
jgi:hypothetical protein